jgi:hypothetical protein
VKSAIPINPQGNIKLGCDLVDLRKGSSKMIINFRPEKIWDTKNLETSKPKMMIIHSTPETPPEIRKSNN